MKDLPGGLSGHSFDRTRVHILVDDERIRELLMGKRSRGYVSSPFAISSRCSISEYGVKHEILQANERVKLREEAHKAAA